MPDSKPQTIRELFLRSQRDLLTFLTRRVGRDDAPDLLQETFARYINRDAAAEIADPPAYLRRTAGNLVKDFARHRQVERKYFTDDGEAADAPSQMASAESLVDDARRALLLAQAVATLPPRCREIFELRVTHNLSQREIAERLGISRKTVEQHFHLAMERCRAALQQ
ncbi:MULTISPECIES: RNA polymerase sigma factor [Methylosinus]|uniref:RNA polymerase subunit sigma-24 n=1 Tax=Methylosinus trichosporium (strain ATCC 35070 / NCIMB 11131 / UNIQEM 75 / OB3b) TaxID=595536 RepID=A0A2D2D5D9_METT3|nr:MULTISPECIES: sigma-70 family RNA polymerase sigma factor [Methylosinus]ATQ70185.1 RNA polymerase subunit sigma-24 [Methylosinus trichosporium OB3b]OBS54175.1 RNA polymerase subunit sigma-24 [Methylosinus sp. 3S-1]